MKPVLILRHVPHETLGTLETHLSDAGLELRNIDVFAATPARLDLEHAAALVVLGGPMNVDEVQKYPFLRAEIGWLQEAVARQLPTLGICLGSQLLASALGAKVYPNRVKEIGWYELDLTPAAQTDPLFAGSRPVETVFQWHGKTFNLPAGAVHLARGKTCPHQAFRFGPSAYGLQFHAEMTAEMIESCFDEPGNRRELSELDYIDPVAILAQLPHCFAAMESLGSRIWSRLAALAVDHARQ